MGLPMLPSTIPVTVNGTVLDVAGLANKAGTRIWYNLNGIVRQSTDDPEGALGRVTAEFDGTPLKKGEVHVSEPSLSRKTGKVLPNTGGNWTVTLTSGIVVADRDGNPFKFTLMVTTTYLAEKGFRTAVKALPLRESTVEDIDGLVFA